MGHWVNSFEMYGGRSIELENKRQQKNFKYYITLMKFTQLTWFVCLMEINMIVVRNFIWTAWELGSLSNVTCNNENDPESSFRKELNHLCDATFTSFSIILEMNASFLSSARNKWNQQRSWRRMLPANKIAGPEHVTSPVSLRETSHCSSCRG